MTQTPPPPSTNGLSSDIICDEVNSSDAAHWVGSITNIGSDYDAVLSHAHNKTLKIVERAGIIEIFGRDRVGMIGLPSGRRILINTKIPGIMLLDWLIYLHEFPDLQQWTSGGNVHPSDSWQIVLARLFLRELEVVTRSHLRKGFVEMSVTSPHVRGRILTGRLSQRLWRLPSIPQVIRGRSLNTPANQMLAAALDQIVHFQPDLGPDSARLFEQLRNDWFDISRIGIDRYTIIQASLAAPPDGYRSALQLARLILLGASVHHSDCFGGQTFTLSLSRIWEDAVTQMCRDLEPETGWMVAPRSQSVRLWDDATGPDDRRRSLIADTLLVRGNDRWVLDAKYKNGFGNEDRNDRFQMCAYAARFGAERATLVYPTSSGQSPSCRVLLDTVFGSRPFFIDAAACEISKGPDFCKRVLLRELFSGTIQ